MLDIDIIEDRAVKEQVWNEIQQLKEHKIFVEQLNDASIDQVIAFDIAGKIIACNKTFADRWKTEKKFLIGKPLQECIPLFKKNEILQAAMERSLQGFKMFVSHEKGSYKNDYYEHHFIPIKEEQQKIKAVLVIIHDVAHRIKSELELIRLNKELQKKNDELNELNKDVLALAYLVGHNLKKPLKRIYSFTEIILRDEGHSLTARAKSYCHKIQAAAQRSRLLTEDIHTFSLVHPENCNNEHINLNEILATVKNELHNKLLTKDITLVAPHLPNILGAASQIEKLFHVIINHASNTVSEEQPAVTIYYEKKEGSTLKNSLAEQKPYHAIHFSFYSKETYNSTEEKAFDFFYNTVNAHKNQNTAVGFAICKKICEAHGGFIEMKPTQDNKKLISCYLQG